MPSPTWVASFSLVCKRFRSRVAGGAGSVPGEEGNTAMADSCSTRLRGPIDRVVMGFEERLDAFTATLPAESGLLDPAERGRGVGDQPPVDADHPDFETIRDPQRVAEVGGVHVRGEAVHGIVGTPEHFLLV